MSDDIFTETPGDATYPEPASESVTLKPEHEPRQPHPDTMIGRK